MEKKVLVPFHMSSLSKPIDCSKQKYVRHTIICFTPNICIASARHYLITINFAIPLRLIAIHLACHQTSINHKNSKHEYCNIFPTSNVLDYRRQ